MVFNMEIQIISEKENPVLRRKEIVVAIKYDAATPSKAELQKILAEKLNAATNKIEISKIISDFGSSSGKALVKLWEEKTVPIYSELAKQAPQKKEETPKEAPQRKTEKADEKKEEKKEEKSKEEKPKEEAEKKQEAKK